MTSWRVYSRGVVAPSAATRRDRALSITSRSERLIRREADPAGEAYCVDRRLGIDIDSDLACDELIDDTSGELDAHHGDGVAGRRHRRRMPARP